MSIPATGKKRFDGVKAVEIAVGVVLLAGLAVFFAGYIPFSHPLLTARVTTLLKKSGADTCTIGNARITVWKGLSLHNMVITGSLPPDRRYNLQARSMSIEANCARIALRRAAVREALMREIGGLGGALKTAPAAALRRLVSSTAQVTGIKGIGADKADIRLSDRRGDVFSGREVNAHVSAVASGPGFGGSWSAAQVAVRGIGLFSDAHADFSGSGDTFTLSGCRAKFLEGKVRCDARFHAAGGRLAAGSVSLNGCNIDKWYEQSDTAHGRCRGRADFKMALDSSALAVDSLRGNGSVSIARFEISDFPFQQTLVGLLLYQPVMHLSFKKFTCNFSLKPGGVFVTDAAGEGDSLTVKATGTISLDGKINERFVCTLSKQAVNGLPDLAKKSLEDAPGGGRVLRFRLYGPVKNPKFEIDSQIILQKTVKNVFDDVRQNLQLWLKNNKY